MAPETRAGNEQTRACQLFRATGDCIPASKRIFSNLVSDETVLVKAGWQRVASNLSCPDTAVMDGSGLTVAQYRYNYIWKIVSLVANPLTQEEKVETARFVKLEGTCS